MGTVGLSFGSPTGGSGFDVTATVNAIVGNLQAVETPWKNQLTALQGQDAVFSNLGSLFSSLSNDIGQLTDFQGILAQKTGSSSNTNVLELSSASSTATAGTHTVTVGSLAQTSSGYLTPIKNSADALAGSISIQVGAGPAQTITLGSSSNTLKGLAAAINSAGAGVTASVLTDSSGARLSLVSKTSGGNGQLTITSSITDSSNSNTALGYSSSTTGKDALLNVDGVDLTSASNTVTDLIPGVTFQLLSSAPGAPVQVVIGNDNATVESTVNTMVNDYNALITSMNTQEGNDSSGKPNPLYGSPTLSLLQQQLLGSLTRQNPNGYLDAVVNSGDTLSGSISISLAGGIPLHYSGRAGAGSQASTGTLSPISGAGDALSGSITLAVGSGTAQTIKVGDSSTPHTLAGLASAINTAGIGVMASVVTNSDGSSSLSLLSATPGTAGTLTVTSAIADTSTQTIQVPASPGNDTLAGLASAINSSHSGVTANVVTDGTGSRLVLVSGTAGSGGIPTVISSLTDATTGKALNYNGNTSDVAGLTSLGISVNNDGTLKLDASVLDSILNSDYSGVVGFFQDANSWGMTFSHMLNNAGTTSSTGILALAEKSNATVESTLNKDISNEESRIAAQKKSLTLELNTANEILQALPSQLNSVNEIYSALTGYNSNRS